MGAVVDVGLAVRVGEAVHVAVAVRVGAGVRVGLKVALGRGVDVGPDVPLPSLPKGSPIHKQHASIPSAPMTSQRTRFPLALLVIYPITLKRECAGRTTCQRRSMTNSRLAQRSTRRALRYIHTLASEHTEQQSRYCVHGSAMQRSVVPPLALRQRPDILHYLFLLTQGQRLQLAPDLVLQPLAGCGYVAHGLHAQ